MKYRLWRSGKVIDLSAEKKLGEGGEARVYRVTPLGLAAKIYHQADPRYAAKLKVMLENPPADPPGAQGHVSIAWPSDLVLGADGRCHGYVMPLVEGMEPLVNFYVPKLRRKVRPLFDYYYLVTAGLNVAATVRALHEGSHVIGDMNESNVLLSDRALAAIVDTDSFQVADAVTGTIHRCPVGKPEFTPPELNGVNFAQVDRTEEHDRFGLAVMLFQLLMEGTHPFDGIYAGAGEPPAVEARIAAGHFPHGPGGKGAWRPKPGAPPFEMLEPGLQLLFLQCFLDGHRQPSARPDATAWRTALARVAALLRTCRVNSRHRYWDHLPCPWCERAWQLGGVDPFPSVEAVKQKRHLIQRSRGARTPQSAAGLTRPLVVAPAPAGGGGATVAPSKAAVPPAPLRNRKVWVWAGAAAMLFILCGTVFHIHRSTKRRTRQAADSSGKLPEARSAVPARSPAPDGLENSTVRTDIKDNRPPGEDTGDRPREARLVIPEGALAGEERQFEIAKGASVTMCWIPAGRFTMGSPVSEAGRSDDENPVQVRLTHGFWLAKTECTQKIWAAVMETKPSYFQGEDLPVEQVSVKDCQNFIARLRQPEGNWRFDLPTEAQWEYACRAGIQAACAGALEAMAWYGSNSGGTTHSVGTRQPNAWGLQDMYGNVWEWCRDAYQASLPGGIDPEAEAGTNTVYRGGSWFSAGVDCRSASRDRGAPTNRGHNLGFRLELGMTKPSRSRGKNDERMTKSQVRARGTPFSQ